MFFHHPTSVSKFYFVCLFVLSSWRDASATFITAITALPRPLPHTHTHTRTHTLIFYLIIIFTRHFLMSIVKTFVTVIVQYINSTLVISHCLIINVILHSLFMHILGYYPEIRYDCFKICCLLEGTNRVSRNVGEELPLYVA